MTTRASMDQFPASDKRGRRRFGARAGRSIVMLLVAAIMVSALSAWTPSHTAAQESTGPASAWLWANEPTAEETYTPDERYQFNSEDETNTVTRTGVGTYTATLPGVGREAGHFQVTGQGEAASCTNVRWMLDGTTFEVEVACYDASGAPVDSGFTVLYVAAGESESGTVAYIWANNPTSEETYTPDEHYQFNSTGETNTVTRTGVGTYTANLPGVGQEAGTFLATGQGEAASCTIVRWILDGTEMQVEVACYDASGAPVDSGFLLLYILAAEGAEGGYLWANEPTAEETYTPDERYQFNSAGERNTVTRTGVGTYTADLPGVGKEEGTVQVTGQGEAASCTIVRWILDGSDMQVEVACYDASGAPVDSGFLVSYSIG